VIWQGTRGRLQQSDITFRPGRAVTGAYGQCHRSARRSMPGAKLEPTRSRTLHVLFHSWMEQEQILVKVSCSISDALWVNGLLNKLLSLSANSNSVSIVGQGSSIDSWWCIIYSPLRVYISVFALYVPLGLIEVMSCSRKGAYVSVSGFVCC